MSSRPASTAEGGDTEDGRSRLPIGPILAVAGGILLAVSLLLVWFTVDPPQGVGNAVVARTGWDSFGSIDISLTLAGVLGALAGATALARPETSGLNGVIAVMVGLFAALLVTVRMIDEPGSDAASDIEVGPFIALLATMLLVAGGILMLDRQGPGPGIA